MGVLLSSSSCGSLYGEQNMLDENDDVNCENEDDVFRAMIAVNGPMPWCFVSSHLPGV